MQQDNTLIVAKSKDKVTWMLFLLCQGCVAHVWISQDWFPPWGIMLCPVQICRGVAALGKCQLCLCRRAGLQGRGGDSLQHCSYITVWPVSKGRFISLFSAPLSLWCLFNTLHVLLAYCICRAVITSLVAQTLLHLCVLFTEGGKENDVCGGSLLLEKELKALHERGACLVPYEWVM